MEHYTGTCQGGPYNGQTQERDCKEWVIAWGSKPELQLMQTLPPDTLPEILYGTYRFAMGFWIWKADAQYPRRETRP